MNITVVGGGASGWLTALYLNKISPQNNITLIESKEIGILGVGEGTIPNLIDFLQFLEVDIIELYKESNSTIKLGISFENWKKPGDKFFHGFPKSDSPVNFLDPHHPLNKSYSFYPYLVNYLSHTSFIENESSILAYSNSSPFINTSTEITNVIPYAFHFDATLLAHYLEKIAKLRNINYIEGKVTQFNTNTKGDIESLTINNSLKHESDFFFDCSGFSRLLIGKHYKTKWISCKNKLKVNNALSFTLNSSNPIPPYTKSIAMKYGWMWQIPLQNRVGCGYVFDSNYTTKEKAIKEIEDLFGHPIKINKHIQFETGYYKNTWVNNCISVGLSGGFVEPLEATSLWLTTIQLQNISISSLLFPTNSYKEHYNKKINSLNKEIVNFLHLHYLTDRQDTPFWRDYKSTTKLSKSLSKKLTFWENNIPTVLKNTKFSLFNIDSYLIVGLGISDKIFNISLIKNINKILNLDYSNKDLLKNHKEYLKNLLSKTISHNQFINIYLKK